MRGHLAAIAAAAGLLSPLHAAAQAYQCRVPQSGVTVPDIRPQGRPREMPTEGYTLALSWSPEYCRFRKDSRRDARQCSGQGGRFGFVVHGLWPDGPGDRWPQWCPNRRDLQAEEARRNMCMIPDARLQARQWEKHGSCRFSRPETYYKVTRILWNSLRWPDFDRLSRKRGLTAGDIRETFAQANPYWEPEHVGLKLNSRGWLQEMRLCYGADFMPTRCEAHQFGPPGSARAKIWRGL
ncbi:ribonuclease T2 family protein [Paraurantiacibacter namhicola]|uniref:Ribonuclease I n=1 Tax=Paraurantiacibacter namhicola TaxID=645517 RepID=A0A1C7D5T2_9SPHN|nr:ribonuclease T [Paraurantiacibacter namhicola]ANU06815.1 Ribonuclease I precursor [Paraurantiacibacter namhicola]